LTAQAGGSTVLLVLSLLTDLREFVARHRAHGQLTADATEGAAEVSKADARAYKKSLFTAPSNRAGAKDALGLLLVRRVQLLGP
jgi:hypothetical protein